MTFLPYSTLSRYFGKIWTSNFFSPISMKLTDKVKLRCVIPNLKTVCRYLSSFSRYRQSKLGFSRFPKFLQVSDSLYGRNTKMALSPKRSKILTRDRCQNLFHQISHKKYFCQKVPPPLRHFCTSNQSCSTFDGEQSYE